jgi:hypothetical protein
LAYTTYCDLDPKQEIKHQTLNKLRFLSHALKKIVSCQTVDGRDYFVNLDGVVGFKLVPVLQLDGDVDTNWNANVISATATLNEMAYTRSQHF